MKIRGLLLTAMTGLGLVGLVVVLGSALVLTREAARVHPVLGWLVVVIVAVGLTLLLVAPVVQVLRLRRVLVRPVETEGPKWQRFVRRYGARLAKNPRLRAGYAEYSALESARSGGAPFEALEAEVVKALAHLDEQARTLILQHAAAVFTATAISQSGRLDALVVFSTQLRMIREIALVYYQRPTLSELWALYANVGAAAFVAGEIEDSELLAVLGAPFTAAMTGFIPVPGTDPLVSLLVNSLLDGSANAFLTLRVGVLAHRSCGLRVEADRRALARSASVEAAGLLGGAVGAGARRIAVLTQELITQGVLDGATGAARGVLGALGAMVNRISAAASGSAKSVGSRSAGEMRQWLETFKGFWERVGESDVS
jgi:hypothetical protein